MDPTDTETPQGRACAPGLSVGISEQTIKRLVHAFYGKVRADPDLGPVFDRIIAESWDEHLAKMCDFWSSVVLMTGRYKGKPMLAHVRIPDIAPPHFDRWLQLFRQTAGEVCSPEAAALFIDRAERIAESLQLGIDFHRGKLPERLRRRA